jgi:predicted DCC family thiol-disulfide oxidoreductase YuxK
VRISSRDEGELALVLSPALRAEDYDVVQITPDISGSAIVLFDGVCGLCNWSIDFLIRRDHAGTLRFAPLQSPVGRQLLEQHGLTANECSSAVTIDCNRVYRRSDAVLQALTRLGTGWRLLAAAGRLIPRSLRDVIYDWVATNRYRWFGQRTACRVPTREERARFLPGSF